jgi:hypothetical protein
LILQYESIVFDVAPPEEDISAEPPRQAIFSQGNRIGLTIFAGAFLLFQVQLLMGKYILPWFGGTPAVWTACLLFFQVLLLAGYAYAHFVATRLTPSQQSRLHAGLLVCSLLLLIVVSFLWPSPITPGSAWKPQPDANPTILILRFLFAAIGLPFFLLSSTGPLVQHWFSQKNPGVSPYRLYSLSNLGSLLGLLSYPLLLEPNLRLRTQAWLWCAGYLLYAILCASVAPWRISAAESSNSVAVTAADRSLRPTLARRLSWVLLAACGSAMLLSVTNIICQQVAVFPFLWVLPLCLYLTSFIICFEYSRFYRRGPFHAFFALTAVTACAVLLQSAITPLFTELIVFLAVMFACCMVCHGEIALTKPAPSYLTGFYLSVSLGGAIGGVFVSVIAPMIFPNLWEFPLSILATGAFLLLAVRRDANSWWYRPLVWMPFALSGTVLLLIPGAAGALGVKISFLSPMWYRALAGALFLGAGASHWVMRGRPARSTSNVVTRGTALVALSAVALGFVIEARLKLEDSVARSRNFYGVLAVLHDTGPGGDFLFLRDRMTDHGRQYADPVLARQPSGYYGPNSGIHILLRSGPARPIRVGVVGLGTGTLAAFSRPGDVFRFYEINPAVIQFAQGDRAYFTYLRDARGKVDVVSGDARLSLEREAAQHDRQQFDVLVLDAFSGDAIPVHLLTREAFDLYREHLRSADAIIAIHITNRSLDLSPVLSGIARDLQFSTLRIYRPWLNSFSSQTDWVLMSQNPASLRAPELAGAGRSIPVTSDTPVWTDDYSNLLEVLR